MVDWYVLYNNNILTIIQAWPYSHRDLCLYFALEQMIVFVGHDYGFASSMGQLRLDSVKLIL
jgi:hypothetical protein